MDDCDDQSEEISDLVVERGNTYNHTEYGQVEVTGLWRGVEKVDEAHHSKESDTYIVRYSATIDGDQVDELTDTLDEFIQAID